MGWLFVGLGIGKWIKKRIGGIKILRGWGVKEVLGFNKWYWFDKVFLVFYFFYCEI